MTNKNYKVDLFQPMRCTSVDSSSRTAHRLRLRFSPLCSLRRSSSPKKVSPRLCCSLVNALATRRLATNFFRFQAVRCCAFSLVGNAHRAFRGEKHGRMPFGRSTVKHYIIEKFTRIFISANAASVRRRAFRYNHAFILAVSAGAPTLRFKRLGLFHETNIRIPKNPAGHAVRQWLISSAK